MRKPANLAIKVDNFLNIVQNFENSERFIQSLKDRVKNRGDLISFYNSYISREAENPLPSFHKICFFDFVADSDLFKTSWFVIEEMCDSSIVHEQDQNLVDSILYCLESLDIHIESIYLGKPECRL